MQNSHWISWKIATKASNMPSQDIWKFTPVSYRTSALWGRTQEYRSEICTQVSKHALLVGRHIAKRITSKCWSERKLWFFFIFDLFSLPLPVCVSPRFYSSMYEDFLGVRSFNQLYDVSFERTYVGIWQGADDCLRIVNWVAMEWIQPSKYVKSDLISFLVVCFATLIAKFWSVICRSVCLSLSHNITIKAFFYIF